MAFTLKAEEQQLIRQLIVNICKYETENVKFKSIEKQCLKELTTAPSFFANPNDIEKSIKGLCDKFLYHNLPLQAHYLRQLADDYLKKPSSNYDLQNSLNVMQFLILMSNKPTSASVNFKAESLINREEDVVDWTSYLLPDSERWNLQAGDTDSSWSDSGSEQEQSNIVKKNDVMQCPLLTMPTISKPMNALSALDEIKESNWINKNLVRIIPKTSHPVLTIGLQWEKYTTVTGKLNIIPEYVVAREIIFEFFSPHNNTVFAYDGRFIPKHDVTIASAMPVTLCNFLHNFVPYLEYFDLVRKFEKLLEYHNANPPETYKSYLMAQKALLQPLYLELCNLDLKLKNHNSFTLLALHDHINEKFKMIKVMTRIHNSVIMDFKKNSNLACTVNLLSKLYQCCLHSTTKLEQDLCLTIYLETLFKYIMTIDAWLTLGVIRDNCEEFVIADSINQREGNWQMNINVRDLNNLASHDALLKVICKDIYAINWNIHILRLLEKLEINDEYKGTLYNEFINRVLRKISVHFACEGLLDLIDAPVGEIEDSSELFEHHNLDELFDTSDSFLRVLFEDLLIKKSKSEEIKKRSLYDKISCLTKGLLPCEDIIHTTLLEVVKERFEYSGAQIISVLRNDCHIDKHIKMLKCLYLFKDDILFPFYKRLFIEIKNTKKKATWADEISLNSHIQDILFDISEDLSSNCFIVLKENIQYCHDPLKTINFITIQYKIHWPLNIFITNEHIEKYKEIFQFVLKIKWALDTLNECSIKNVFVKKFTQVNAKLARSVYCKVHIIKFELLQIFNTIQHYVLGHLFMIYTNKLDNDLENAKNFDDIKFAHVNFINNIYDNCIRIRDVCNNSYGFKMMLYMVKRLPEFYSEPVKQSMLEDILYCLKKCYENVESVMNWI